MKFGKTIVSQQEANVDLHYLEYKSLKKNIKDVVARQQASEPAEALNANAAFEEELSSEIGRVNHCFADCLKSLRERTSNLSEELQRRKGRGTSSGSGTSASTQEAVVKFSGDGAASVQRPDALRLLVDILGEVDQLRKYAVWNAVAVVKILKKRRKQTNLGIEDSAAERTGWLSRQTFFSGSDFAELHVAIESLGHMLVRFQYAEMSGDGELPSQMERTPQQCPICLDTIVDMVELSCGHQFCWKCFVLGPIAFQPGEYRITQCPICRKGTSQAMPELNDNTDEDGEGSGLQGAELHFCRPERELTRFLHTYFPQESFRPGEGKDSDAEQESRRGSEQWDEWDMRDVVELLVKALLEGPQSSCKSSHPQESSDSSQDASASRRGAGAIQDDFFMTLPQKTSQEKTALGTAQKLQWLQLASTGDPLALDGTMYCSLCSEPLLMEAVTITPCKHYFHRVCIRRLEMPQCPLCTTALPFSWFLPSDHPCIEHGFRVVPARAYKPQFAGGPSRGSGGFTLHRPPPISLHGPNGIIMKSYLHRLMPMGCEEEEEGQQKEEEEAQSHKSAGSTSPCSASPDLQTRELEDAGSSASESSSEESGSEDGGSEMRVSHKHNCSRPKAWVYTALGGMRLCEQPDEALKQQSTTSDTVSGPTEGARGRNVEPGDEARGLGSGGGSGAQSSKSEGAEVQRNPMVLLIGDHL